MDRETFAFDILKHAAVACQGSASATRLGRLKFPGRRPIDTPHYVAVTSRGVIPHISQDVMIQRTGVSAVYVALEDFIERAPRETPPIYNFAKAKPESPLRRFIALQPETLLFMGPRRIPAVSCPRGNTETAVSIFTSVGSNKLEIGDYAEAARALKPDVIIGLGDAAPGQKSGSKRVLKVEDRTLLWTRKMIDTLAVQSPETATPTANHSHASSLDTVLFAPVPPIPRGSQFSYLEYLEEDVRDRISGLAIYDSRIVADLPQGLQTLPRICLDEPDGPHQILTNVSRGVDLFTIPFISTSTDAGIALDISFPPEDAHATSQSDEVVPKALGVDMWLSSHATSVSPLRDGCQCHTCTNHHRAYVQHLLSAKEMLGWVLLQLHNLYVMDQFFAGVRRAISEGMFEDARAAFGSTYLPNLPEKTGQGPRVRGYQYKSSGPGEIKKNTQAYRPLVDGPEAMTDAPDPSIDADGEALTDRGFAEKAMP